MLRPSTFSSITKVLSNAGFFLTLSAGLAFAGETATAMNDAGMPSNCSNFAAKVSGSEGNWGSVNQYGCLGAFQFCNGLWKQYYDGTAQGFLDDPKAQVIAWTQYEQNEWSKAQKNGLTDLIGQQVCSNGSCFTVDQSAILMACQFGCGKGGKLYNLANGAGCDSGSVKDGNGVSVCEYLRRGDGYDVSCFTGQTATATGSPAGTCKEAGEVQTSTTIIAASAPAPAASDVIVADNQI